MKQATMKIQKGDVPVILLSALGGFLLVFLFFLLASKNLGAAVLVGLVFGVPSGAGGGTLACICRRYLAPELTVCMTTALWRQIKVNALIRGFRVALEWLVLAILCSIVLRQGVAWSFRIAISVLWAVSFLVFLSTWLYSRLSRGHILLDCGPHPSRRLFVVISVLFVFIEAGGIYPFTPDHSSAASFALAGSFGLFWLLIAFGRLQVTDRGIWHYWGLLRWNKVGSYRWADDSTLLVTPKRRFLLRGALPLPVPPEHKQAVTDFLSQFCGVQHLSEPGAGPNEWERGQAN